MFDGKKVHEILWLSSYKLEDVPMKSLWYHFMQNNQSMVYTFQTFTCKLFSFQVPIEAEPFFTIPLKDQHVDKGADLTWRCIASGIPTVVYSWYRNATILQIEDLPSADQARYKCICDPLFQ